MPNTNSPLKNFDAELYKLLANESVTALYEWNIETNEFFFDNNFKKIIGNIITRSNFSNIFTTDKIIHPDDLDMIKYYIDFARQPNKNITNSTYRTTFDYRILKENGSYVWVRTVLLFYFKDSKAYRVIGSLADVDPQYATTEQLRLEAERDFLSGLYNKRYFQNIVKSIITCSPEQHALLVIDLDGFKNINDTFGHLFGDAVITNAALNIKNTFRKTDIIGRIGGDEFAVFLKNTVNTDIINQKCQYLCRALRQSYDNDGTEITVSASVGIALYPNDGTDYTTLFKKADTALYASKAKGKDVYTFYHPQLLDQAIKVSSGNTNINVFSGNSFKENTLEYIFDLLYKTHNVSATINVLLKLLGSYFKLSRSYIISINYNNMTAESAFEWTEQGISSYKSCYTQKTLDTLLSLYQETAYGSLAECSDTHKLPENQKVIFQKANIRAFLHCQITDNSGKLGCIAFECCDSSRLWTKKEREVLGLIAKILGTFLLKQNKFDELAAENDILHHLLNIKGAYIYAIDKSSYEILYMNKNIAAEFGEQITPQKCYQLCLRRTEPCEKCPLKLLNSENYEAIMENTTFRPGTVFYLRAFNLNWKNNDNVALVVATVKQSTSSTIN